MTDILKIDNKTLEDLDILPDSRSLSILNLLNSRVKTTDAKLILKTALLSPLCKLDDIIEKQTELQFVINNMEMLSAGQFDDRIIYNCRDYLNSNIVGIKTSNRLHAFIHTWALHKFIPILTSGISGMLALLHEIAKFSNTVQCNPPGRIANILQIFSNYIKEVEQYSIYTNKSRNNFSDIDILILDYVFRVQLGEQSRNLLSALITIDALIAMAKFNVDYKLVFPKFSDDNNSKPHIDIDELKHVAISNCIPNSIQLNESQNMIYVTGPNMSGKSSFLKAFGWAVFLSHLGMGVPAKSMSLTIFDEIICNINNVDNIGEGQSFFLSEVRRVKEIAEKVISGKKVLVICDELFKGTNVIDASECTQVIVEGFAARKNSIFLIASHIYDINNKISSEHSIGWFYFEGLVNNNTPTFSYLLREGISEQRNGLLILKNEGVCELLRTKNCLKDRNEKESTGPSEKEIKNAIL